MSSFTPDHKAKFTYKNGASAPGQPADIDYLREIEARYHALVDGFNGFIYMASRDFRIRYMNHRFIKQLGFDATGEYCYKAIHNRDSVCPWCKNDQVFSGRTVNYEIQSPVNGRWFQVVNAPLYHPDGTTSKFSMIIDITDRKTIEHKIVEQRDLLGKMVETRTAQLSAAKERLEAELAAMEKAEREYRLLIENASDAIVVTQDGKLVFSNRRVEEISGRSSAELKQVPFTDFIHPDDREMVMTHHIRRLGGKEMPLPYIMRIIDRNQKIIWAENRGVLISWNNRPATLNFLADVSSRIEAENNVRKLSRRLLQARENERMKISMDLHDSVAQDLAFLQMGLESMTVHVGGDGADGPESTADGVMKKVEDLALVLKKVIANVRSLSHGLKPQGIEQLGLVRVLYQLCTDFSSSHEIFVDFSSAGMEEIDLPLEKTINIYRILHEALSNAARHSGTDIVNVRIIASYPDIICRVHDNGRGFDVANPVDCSNNSGMGLWTMSERSALIGAAINIESVPGRGTRVLLRVPIS